jgi:hypothetical protein
MRFLTGDSTSNSRVWRSETDDGSSRPETGLLPARQRNCQLSRSLLSVLTARVTLGSAWRSSGARPLHQATFSRPICHTRHFLAHIRSLSEASALSFLWRTITSLTRCSRPYLRVSRANRSASRAPARATPLSSTSACRDVNDKYPHRRGRSRRAGRQSVEDCDGSGEDFAVCKATRCSLPL